MRRAFGARAFGRGSVRRVLASRRTLRKAVLLAACLGVASLARAADAAPPAPPASRDDGAAVASTDAPPTAPLPAAQARPSTAPAEAPLTAPREPEASHPVDAASGERVRIRYELAGIEVRGNARTRARVVLRYVPFRKGDLLDVDDPEIELARYRLLGTGFFANVQMSLRKGPRRGTAVLVVDVVERNTIVVNDVWMGLTADADQNGRARPVSAYGGVDVAETNLAGTGISLGGAIGVAQDQLALRTRFVDPAFLGGGFMASATLLYNDARDFFGNRDVLYVDPAQTDRVDDFAVVRYKRFGGTLGVGHDLSVPTQLWLEMHLEQVDAHVPLAASHRRGLDVEPIDFSILPGKSVLSTARAALFHDTRDQPILPTRGSYAAFIGDLSLSPLGSDYRYTKLQVRASRWWTLWRRHVARLEVYGGAVSGDAPFFEKFYVGDFTDLLPDRVLDLNPDRRPAPNFLGTDVVEVRYGDYAAKVQGEYRIPIYRGSRAVYGVDFFGAAGVYGVASARDLRDPPRGYSGLARLPVDLTFNLGLRIDTNAGGFVFAFSNILGFIPVRGEARP